MHRSFDTRVEVLTPIMDGDIRNYLKNELLLSYLKDDVNAHILRPDGTYKKVVHRGEKGFDSQMHFVGAVNLS
jgi:polyphosphate kinase